MVWIKDGEPENGIQKLFTIIDSEGNSPNKNILEAALKSAAGAKVLEFPVIPDVKEGFIVDYTKEVEPDPSAFILKTTEYRIYKSKLYVESN